jgi:hypothetical protein
MIIMRMLAIGDRKIEPRKLLQFDVCSFKNRSDGVGAMKIVLA